MRFRFRNFLGTPYRGRNVLVADNSLILLLVGNRISAPDLTKSQTQTLPYEASSNISRIAVSPDVVFLIAVDDSSRALFINLRHHIVLGSSWVSKLLDCSQKTQDLQNPQSQNR
ncbi:hypothetical protein MRB53_035658 [Persea americana]|uniref:Uncharacterized protein n=1 Tax=Persea americana TaxID=3435 RepID=A0ACC2K5A5_PERAE|nr:hypothetical protein MRB53_035658 [Persea americana]